MAAQDPGAGKDKGKNYSGETPGSFGNLSQQGNYEYMGVHRSAPNPALKSEGGPDSIHDGKEESRDSVGSNFSANEYKGPQNWTPTDEGVVNTMPAGNAPKK